ncbi:Flagellar motor switch protein FliG C-terminal domain-containing protein [Myxococcus xanthus]|nr:hypothetical protein MyxoNM_29150 [Myxococcus xanthus]SDX13685.1 hypothetical protein SAMN05444383_105244 [Myxococcus xanthus]
MESERMDATRVGRKPRPVRSSASVRATAPTEEVPRLVGPLPIPFERLALVAWVLGRERAGTLLGELGEESAVRAREHLQRLSALPSAQRQAKVAVEFGERADAAARLRRLMSDAPPMLRREIFRRLPPYHRTLFPDASLAPQATEVPPALGALAERLIREATR